MTTKKITLTNLQMANAIDLMSRLSEKGTLGYALARNQRKLMDEAAEFIKMKDEAVKKYGTEQGQGQWRVPVDKLDAFNAELAEYTALAFAVDVMTVSPEVFCAGNLTSQQMYILDWMVSDE